MISIITAYYNRKELFRKTLHSIAGFQCSEQIELIAVDDGSTEEERIEDLQQEFPFLKVIRLEKKDKWYQNSCIPFNEGFRHAKGDKIIIQNPECYHFDNVLEYTSLHLKDRDYLSFSCFALDKPTTDNHKISYPRGTIQNCIVNREPLSVNGNVWYNHSKYRPTAYHFCVALMKKDLEILQGFNEILAMGIAYDDDELIQRVKKNLNIKFIDEILVLHQNHYNPKSTSYDNRQWGALLYGINQILYQQNQQGKLINRHTRNLSISKKKFILVPYIIYRLFSDKTFYKLLKSKISKKIF